MKIYGAFMHVFVRIVLWSAVALAIFWLTALVHFVSIIPRNSVGDSVSTDAIVVLTGGSLRIAYGFELLDKGKAKKLLITGVNREASVDELMEKNDAPDALRDISQNEEVIALDFNADSTRMNAYEAAKWMREQKLRSLRMVTANYHVPRSLIEFRRAMPQVIIVPDPVFPERFTLESWWTDSVSRELILSEFHKFLAVWLISSVFDSTPEAP